MTKCFLLYFESIYRMDRFRVYYLAAGQEVWGSQLKGKAGWYEDALQVLCEYWPSTMNALPQYYTNKWEAINKLGYYSCLQPWSFLNFRRGNVYNIHTFFKYRKILTGMSRLNSFQLWSLACLNPKIAYYLALNDLKGYVKECQKIYRLHSYCKKNQKIYIYGAGIIAKRYADYFERKGIMYQGFIVTLNSPGQCKLSGMRGWWRIRGRLFPLVRGHREQTLKDIEIICVNDGSTDDFRQIIDEVTAADNRFKSIHKNNTGYGHSVNMGIRAARGSILAL